MDQKVFLATLRLPSQTDCFCFVPAKSLPKGADDSAWRKMFLSPRFWAVGPIRPSLVRGLRPRNAPSPTTSRRSQYVGNTKLPTRVGPRYPPAYWQIPKMCRRQQDTRGHSHTCPTFTAMTIESPPQKH